jgi:hypothetical protein
MNRRKRLVMALVLVLGALAAWAYEPQPRRYQFVLATTDGPSGWPVFVEDLTFDGRWGAPVGVIGGGFEIMPPSGGKIAGIGEQPIPRTLHARWFSHRAQTFYEIDLELPADLEARVRRWYRKYPPGDFNHAPVPGFAGDGRVFLWWRAKYLSCAWGDRSQDFYAPIIERAQAREVKGNAADYRSQTAQLRSRGVIP